MGHESVEAYSISSTVVTGDQFAEFCLDPRIQSWVVAVKYCYWLDEPEKNPEREWAFACSSGSEGLWRFGNDETHSKYYEWSEPYAVNKNREVATLRPNSFGVFDMSGNLADWTDSSFQQLLRPLFQSIVEDSRDDTSERNMFYNLAGGDASNQHYQL